MTPPDRDPDANSESGRAADGQTCPMCGRPRVEAVRPFCSKRCADLDLQRWFSGRYAIPGAPLGEEDDEPI